VSLNIVPDACTFTFEIRTMPGTDDAAIAARVQAIADGLTAQARAVAPEAGVRLEPFIHYPPLSAQPGGAAAGTVAALAGEPAGGAVDFGTEAGLFQAALDVPVVVCGPGDMAQGHVADEYLEAEQLHLAEAFVSSVGGWLAE
jgi:acetylornithine deacetylase